MTAAGEGSFAYPRSRAIAARGQELLMAVVAIAPLALGAEGRLFWVLSAGAAVSLVWQGATLHHPRRVEVSAEGIAFTAWGRGHRFSWDRVESCRVRRFLVGDRVLVRIAPAPPWRGRYWIFDSIERFDDLVALLQARPGAALLAAGAAVNSTDAARGA